MTSTQEQALKTANNPVSLEQFEGIPILTDAQKMFLAEAGIPLSNKLTKEQEEALNNAGDPVNIDQ